ncbi:uncharacterized protein LOC107791740 [Nicotiana tabacum]|uniref:Uncharacterized protein LOC107791740 n=1 Tax=Nicotiana tabacum TaxID=4097 RepID=A0AC58RV56_TOBAC
MAATSLMVAVEMLKNGFVPGKRLGVSLQVLGKSEGADIRPATGSSLIDPEQGQLPQADTKSKIHHFQILLQLRQIIDKSLQLSRCELHLVSSFCLLSRFAAEAALKRPTKRDEVWKKTHTKSKIGEEAWVEPLAEEAYNRYREAVEELARSQPTDEQGQSIMPSEEETLPLWLNVVGGVHKGRAYSLSSERNFHCLACGLQGIGTSAIVQNENLEKMRRTIQQLSRNYADEREKRKHEEKIRDALRNDIDSLKAQVNHLIGLPRSPPKSHIYVEDESDGNNTNDKEDEGESEDE